MTRLRVLGLVTLFGVLAVLMVNKSAGGLGGTQQSDALAVPPLVLSAYVSAAAGVSEMSPDCAGMSWPILAGVGAVESAHAQGRTLAPNGDVTPHVIGPRLDGSGLGGNVTPVLDTDGGALDGDLQFDRAVGPMQFLPETWRRWGRDGNGDGTSDPENIFDASLGAAAYLCGSAPVNLADRAQLSTAIARYNGSASYVASVLAFADSYAAGA